MSEKQPASIKPGRGGKRPGAGRKAGVPNKVTAELKDMILGALGDAGGQAYLVKQANANPNAFLALIGRVLPTTLNTEGNKPKRLIVSWEE